MIGKQYSNLLVLRELEKVQFPSTSMRQYLCRCVCGTEVNVLRANLLSGRSTSCGCKKDIKTALRFTKHGQSTTPEYKIYIGIKKRCYNPKYKEFHLYGGKGVKMCERWLQSYENFIADMGPRPSVQHSIDRVDPNGDYCPQNCQWATPHEQNINRKGSIFVTFRGSKMHITDFAALMGFDYQQTYNRIVRQGLSIDETIKSLMSSQKATINPSSRSS